MKHSINTTVIHGAYKVTLYGSLAIKLNYSFVINLIIIISRSYYCCYCTHCDRLLAW